MRMRLVATVGAVLFTAAGGWAQPVSITACGQAVGDGESGVVETDLTCPGGAGTFVVEVGNAGSLDLAGHTLAGASTGVRCARRCTIGSTGATGTIRDAEIAGIAAVGLGGRLTLSNLDLDNDGLALLTDFDTGKVLGTDLTLTNNGIAVQARKIRLTGLTATGNFTVAQARKTILEGSVVTGSGDTAILGRVAVLMDSTVTGSGSGIDLMTERPPRVINSTCEVSRNLSNPTQTWGVCAND